MRKTAITIVILAIIGISNIGCVSGVMTMYHNANAERLIRIQASSGQAAIGIDLTKIGTGYFSAWKEDPIIMGGALISDLGLGFLSYRGIVSMTDNGNDDLPPPPPIYNEYKGDFTSINQTGNGNSLQYQGSMNNSAASSSSTTTNSP